MSWLKTPLGDDYETIAAGKHEHLAIYINEAFQKIKRENPLSQRDDELQKLEDSVAKDKEAGLEILYKLLCLLAYQKADLIVAVKTKGDCYQISDNDGDSVVLISKEVRELANKSGVSSVQDYINNALFEHLHLEELRKKSKHSYSIGELMLGEK